MGNGELSLHELVMYAPWMHCPSADTRIPRQLPTDARKEVSSGAQGGNMPIIARAPCFLREPSPGRNL